VRSLLQILRGAAPIRVATRSVVIWLAVAAGGMALLAASWQTLNAQQGDQSSRKPESPGGLLSSNRSAFAVCVEAVAGAGIPASEVQGTVQSVLAGFQSDPRWARLGYDKGAPSVDVGCAHHPVILRPGVIVNRSVTSSRDFTEVPIVSEPSKYLVMMFVMPDAEIDHFYFGLYPERRTAPEEILCPVGVTPTPMYGWKDGRCGPVTTGVYLRESEASDPDVVRIVLANVTGLADRSSRRPTPPGFDPSRPVPKLSN
jgi:hypothetical protein